MQDESSQQTLALMIRGTRVTAEMLRNAIQRLLSDKDRLVRKLDSASSVGSVKRKGKQTLRQLTDQGAQLESVEISRENIGAFGRVARKYGIDYSLKKDKTADPPVFYVFFRARDLGVMEAAFREFSRSTLEKKQRAQQKKRSVVERLREKTEIVKERERNHPVRQRTRQNRGAR